MLYKNQKERFGIIEVDREIKRINLLTRNIHEGILDVKITIFMQLY